MENHSEPKQCPQCQAPISAEAPEGLCPLCLLSEVSNATETGPRTSAKPEPPSVAELAVAFPQLEILELIGRGGMGYVFKARQLKLDRFVALKILPATLAADPAFAERFTQEGKVLARLSHPNIVTIHDFGQANGFFYLMMEFVDGVNLRQAMKVGRFTAEQALAIVPRICEALEFAHHEGILHRDIKPENILLDSKGRVKIADFGIAKILGTDHSAGPQSAAPAQNATGVIGTPQYMAPEQLENRRTIDQRADIYSLGVVFYEMLTGELPLGRFAPPSAKSAADPRLDEVVLRALEKEPERRTPSAGEVKTQVETIAGTSTPNRSSPASLSHSQEWPRLPWALVGLAFVFIINGLLAIWSMVSDLHNHLYTLNFGILTLPTGIGLLRGRPWWRREALGLLGLLFVFCLLLVPMLSDDGGYAYAQRSTMGQTYPLSYATSLGVVSIFLAALVAGMVVLLRRDVRALFARHGFNRPWIEWSALAAALAVAFLAQRGLSSVNVAPPVGVVTDRSPDSPVESHATSKTIALDKVTLTQGDRLSVWTHSFLPPGEVVVAVEKRVDGSVEDAMTQRITIRGATGTGVSTVFSWKMPDSVSDESLETTRAFLENTYVGKPLALREGAPEMLFTLKNRAGGTISGGLAFQRKAPASVGANAAASIRFTSVTNVSRMALGFFESTFPAGYVLEAGAVTPDGAEGEVHTSIGKAPGFDNGTCRWDFPRGFTTAQMQAAVEQANGEKSRSITVSAGERVPVFAVTNDAGGVYKAFFELRAPGAAESTQTSGVSSSRNDEITRRKLTLAEGELREAEAKYEVGVIDSLTLEKARAARDTIQAVLDGDQVAVARINLKLTEMELLAIKNKLAVGAASSLEYKRAELARDVAADDLRTAEAMNTP